MTRSRVGSVVLSTALLCSLAACGGKDDKASDLPTLTPEPSTSVTPTSSPTPTRAKPTGIPTSTVDKYGELTLELRRPAAVDAKALSAVVRFMDLHRAFASMAAGGKNPADLPEIATSGVVGTLNGVLAQQRKAKDRAAGVLAVRVTEAQTSAAIAVVDGCFDQSKVVMIRANGTRYVDPTVKRLPTMRVRVTVTRSTGQLRVSEFTLKEKAC